MRARVSYPVLFLLPAAMTAFVSGLLAAAGGAGIFWIFVFGDDQWPEMTGTLLMALAALVGIGTFVILLSVAYSVGKAREPSGVARRHWVLAAALTVLLPLLVLFHQWQVGNLGRQSVPANNSLKPLRGSP